MTHVVGIASAKMLRVLLAALLVFCSVSIPRPEAAQPAAAPLWQAEMKTLDGEMTRLDAFKGKVAIVYFWASWCAPCHAEAPKLQALHDRMKDKGVTVIGVAIDNAEKAKGFVDKHGLSFPILLGGTRATGGTNATELTKALGNTDGAIPYTVVTDRNGDIAATVRGDSKDGQRLDAIVAPLAGSD
jgi:peroxiredoxin